MSRSFRKKPVVIQAFQLGTDVIPAWFVERLESGDAAIGDGTGADAVMFAEIKTLEGTMRADKDDFVIRGVKGEIYPCKPDIFQATYEEVTP